MLTPTQSAITTEPLQTTKIPTSVQTSVIVQPPTTTQSTTANKLPNDIEPSTSKEPPSTTNPANTLQSPTTPLAPALMESPITKQPLSTSPAPIIYEPLIITETPIIAPPQFTSHSPTSIQPPSAQESLDTTPEEITTDPSTEPLENNNNKCTKLKCFIYFGIAAILAIIVWQLYEHFMHKPWKDYNVTPKEREIHNFTKRIYELELKHNPYLWNINFQIKTKASHRDDRAYDPFIQVSNDMLDLDETKTVTLMLRLFNNYKLKAEFNEHHTAEEQEEQLEFLQAVLETPIMNETMKFLEFSGFVTNNYETQLQLLKDIWFLQYSRTDGSVGSSGFERVFLAEIRDNKVVGLHNWLYFSEQESLKNLNYKGFINRLELQKNSQYVTTVRLQFHHINIPFKTVFVGTSPELEMSLYTTCFLLSAGKPCSVILDCVEVKIITYALEWHGKKTLATAYPIIED